MILDREIKLPDDSLEDEQVSNKWKKQQRYVHKCNEAAWKRWVLEYLVTLSQREP